MVRKSYMVLSSVGIVSILLGSLFYYNMVQGQEAVEYDPWCDINDDGIIDIQDIYFVALGYGTIGNSINKTALLYEVNATFTDLLSRIDSMNTSLLDLEAYLITRITDLDASLVELQSKVNTLEAKVATLKTDVALHDAMIIDLQSRLETLENQTLPQGFMRTPAYDSGWVYIAPGKDVIFTHNLTTTKVLVYMIGMKLGASPYIHQIDYGGELTHLDYYGAYWYDLTTTTIRVHRHGNDVNWDYIRVMIWIIQEPPT